MRTFKLILKAIYFVIGVLLFFVGFVNLNDIRPSIYSSYQLKDINLSNFRAILFFLVGVYILTNLLKSGDLTNKITEEDEQREKNKK